MLVDAQGCEIATDGENGDTRPRLTRGLVAQGFYEVSWITSAYSISSCVAVVCVRTQSGTPPSFKHRFT
jgi:hypothetical protein